MQCLIQTYIESFANLFRFRLLERLLNRARKFFEEVGLIPWKSIELRAI